MHVLVRAGRLVKLGTAVFLENDIDHVIHVVTPLAEELAEQVQICGTAFQHAPAEMTIF